MLVVAAEDKAFDRVSNDHQQGGRKERRYSLDEEPDDERGLEQRRDPDVVSDQDTFEDLECDEPTELEDEEARDGMTKDGALTALQCRPVRQPPGDESR